jgi:hypothetical protein
MAIDHDPVSTPPNYTTRDDDTPLHQQKIEDTGVADTIPRAIEFRKRPITADLVGPEGQYIGWDGI